ncbi:unnamed protein product [Owenia fusiformis]|uniref:Glutaredoxin domain-containing protein n=1 Tax=Owenia fusiformis TaxID=6347 RepID=A0A8S4PUW9_OWEFU|nr:unnamed protein product [Owenia fusiformis]
MSSFVDAEIQSGKKVVVFSKTYCPYCSRCKKVLQAHIGKEITAADFKWIEMDNMSNCSEIQAYLRKITGASSVPRVFINGKSVGGCDETTALDKSGKLSAMLKA